MRGVLARYPTVVLTSATLSPLDVYPRLLGFTPAVTTALTLTEAPKPSDVPTDNSTDTSTDAGSFDGVGVGVGVGSGGRRRRLLPVAVSVGGDQAQMSTRPNMRDEPSVVRNYGNLVAELCGSVPDGVVVFFSSYMYMEKMVGEVSGWRLG